MEIYFRIVKSTIFEIKGHLRNFHWMFFAYDCIIIFRIYLDIYDLSWFLYSVLILSVYVDWLLTLAHFPSTVYVCRSIVDLSPPSWYYIYVEVLLTLALHSGTIYCRRVIDHGPPSWYYIYVEVIDLGPPYLYRLCM